jgi:hypothetical protein
MHDLGYRGSYNLSGTAGLTPGTADDELTFPEWLRTHLGSVVGVGPFAHALADGWQAVAPWVRPAWMAPWSFVYVCVGMVVSVAWVVGEAVSRRRRLVDRVETVVSR